VPAAWLGALALWAAVGCGGTVAPAPVAADGPCVPGSPTPNDADGDGLVDEVERTGWTVTIIDRFGTPTAVETSSDPRVADSDGDGLCDGEERTLDADPRLADSDGDGLDDRVEVRQWGSAPYQVDTDGDGLSDGHEVTLHTSPVLADTDGDGRGDGLEVDETTQPLLSDLPRPALVFVGSMDVGLNLRLASGEVVTNDVSTSLEQSASTSFSRSNTVVNGSSVTDSRSVTASAEASYPWGAKVSVEGTVSQTENSFNETTTSWSRDSTQSSHSAYARALSRTRSQDSEIDGGTLAFQLMIRNEGRRSFRVSQVVVTALRRNPVDPTSFTSIATLALPEAANDLVLGEGEEAGPFRVEAELPTPVALDLLANPSGVFYRVASRRLSDVEHQDFAFSIGETTYNRTASLVVDYGDRLPTETYRIATNARRTPDGHSAGIRMKDILHEVLGWQPGIDYETTSRDGVSTLTQVRGVGVAPDSTTGPARFWVVMASPNSDPGVRESVDARILDPKLDFEDIVLFKRDRVYLAYVQDADRDGLYAREEYLYGTIDDPAAMPVDAPVGATAADSDGDGLLDFDEVRRGWRVELGDGSTRVVYPDPTSADADDDGWSDVQERDQGTDPKASDTDGDGLSDPVDPQPRTARLTLPPVLVDLQPAAEAASVSNRTEIVARFDQALAEDAALYVHGSWQGAVRGSVTLSSDRRSLRFVPDRPFFPGEEVEVTVGDGIVNRDGIPLMEPHVRRFRVAVVPSQGTLTPREGYVAGSGGQGTANLVPGDFDRNGFVDLLGATRHEVVLHRGSATGLVADPSPRSQTGGDTFAAGDLDRDGWLDLVATVNGQAKIRVFLNRADGTGDFGPPIDYRTSGGSGPAASWSSSLALGDIDGDGSLDVVTANPLSGDLSILRNNGDGRFGSVQRVSVVLPELDGTSQSPYSVMLLDADGDGDLDLAAGKHGSQDLTVVQNDAGAFTQAASHPITGPALAVGLAADFDGDGRPDVVTTQEFSGLSMSLNDGSGGFPWAVDLRLMWVPTHLSAGDLDGDGDLDLAATDDTDYFWVLRNDSDATFPTTDRELIDYDVKRNIAMVDADGDGDLDLVTASAGGLRMVENR
jgi:hypothetical protein